MSDASCSCGWSRSRAHREKEGGIQDDIYGLLEAPSGGAASAFVPISTYRRFKDFLSSKTSPFFQQNFAVFTSRWRCSERKVWIAACRRLIGRRRSA